MKYHHFTRNGKQYKLPKKSLLGFMYSHRTALKAIGYTLAFPLAALPFFLPVLIGLLFM